MDSLNAGELANIGAAIKSPNDLGNSHDVEMHWAMKAMEHAEVHYNLITAVDAKQLRLTKQDDRIYELFRQEFPDLNVAKIAEDDLKSPQNKEKWRVFCESFKGEIEDYNMGTLLRLDCTDDYNPSSTTLSIRTQFLAIEIARNREGFNTPLSEKKMKQEEEKAKENKS